MKFNRLYSNNVAKFPDINFNPGLNIVYAEVSKPLDRNVDSHNLGKTVLIDVLDYCLLKNVDRKHVFRAHSKNFRGFVFYLEVETNSGQFVTIRRALEGRKAVSLSIAEHSQPDMRRVAQELWQYPELGVEKAREILDEQLGLTAVRPWNFRKGLTYFLRKQADYQDVFQISKFAVGKDREWKPYLAHVLGFDSALLEAKYENDERREQLERKRRELEDEAGHSSEMYDQVKGLLDIAKEERAALAVIVDSFDFYDRDVEALKTVVEDLESDIAQLNEQLYVSRQEVERIQESLVGRKELDLDELEGLFRQVGVYFGDQLKREYNDLMAFHSALQKDRVERLRARLAELNGSISSRQSHLKERNRQREQLLGTVREYDSFVKYKEYHSQLLSKEAEVVKLEAQLHQLDQLGKIDGEIAELEQRAAQVIQKIRADVNKGNATYSAIRETFTRILRSILKAPALLSTRVNSKGNIEFEANYIVDESTIEATGAGRGTTYKKLLCAAFDMAVLLTYSGKSFYRFVYHDGIFESLDERKKLNLLDEVTRLCTEHNLQYILTVIQADVPRDSKDRRIDMPEGAIIRRLDDSGDQGRLFRMPKF